jgi:hypothetical protein
MARRLSEEEAAEVQFVDTTKPRLDIYKVPCDGRKGCGAKVGETCKTIEGVNKGKYTVPHDARKQAYNQHLAERGSPVAVKPLQKATASITFEEATPEAVEALADAEFEKRVEAVMFGIEFALNVLKQPYPKVLRRLAEMVVEGDND